MLVAGCPSSNEPLPFPVADGGAPTRDSFFLDPRIHSSMSVSHVELPAISGGTMHMLEGTRAVIVADPDRDRIVVVDLVASRVLGETRLAHGAEPTRIAEDASGRVHVVLRGTGEIFSFDPEAVESGTRRYACAMPRGIAYDRDADQLHVACRGGELVTFASSGPVIRTVQLERDLRDVVVRDSHVFVSRFRSAELLELDADGHISTRRVPQTAESRGDPSSAGPFEPAVAWRTLRAPNGDIAMVHQRASNQEVAIEEGGYTGGTRCQSSIVQSTVTFFREDGTITLGPDLSAATLPVDMAISPVLADGSQRVAVVAAANERGDNSVIVFHRANIEAPMFDACAFTDEWIQAQIPNPTSVVYAPDGTLVVLSRDADDIEGRSGAHLAIVNLANEVSLIHLGGEPRFDVGHALFHGNSGAFVACASCHPEGAEDGRVWTFAGIGPRRTPAMHGDLIGTEPFHWDGDMADLEHLVRDVFTERMQGPALDERQVDALGEWLDALPAPVVSPAVDVEAVARGAALFYGSAQCGTCHSGALYSNNLTVDVGTGGAFQVPSLTGVAFRMPVMHSGCATTLHDRFRDDCGGGDMHGLTSHLAPEDVNDLVSFLETL
jgi:hypothetical protein